MAGIARTVTVRGDFLSVVQAIKDASVDEVLMIDAGLDETHDWPRCGGMFGELLAMEAQRKGLAGLVIDGNCRDSAAMRELLTIPIYSRGFHPNAGTAATLFPAQTDVRMAGSLVQPGDYVLGDDDGVVVASPAELSAWLPQAEGIQHQESALFDAVKAGSPLLEVDGLGRSLAEKLARAQAAVKTPESSR